MGIFYVTGPFFVAIGCVQLALAGRMNVPPRCVGPTQIQFNKMVTANNEMVTANNKIVAASKELVIAQERERTALNKTIEYKDQIIARLQRERAK